MQPLLAEIIGKTEPEIYEIINKLDAYKQMELNVFLMTAIAIYPDDAPNFHLEELKRLVSIIHKFYARKRND